MKRFLLLTLLTVWLALPLAGQTSQSYTLTVIPPPCSISITTLALPQAQATVAYSFQMSATSTGNCALPLVWSVSTATGQTGLPTGLSLSSSGLLSGTIPLSYCSTTSCPNATFTISVKDSNGVAISVPMSFGPRTPKTLPTATMGQDYSYRIASGKGRTYKVKKGDALPPGIYLISWGLLSGVPTKKGTYNFTINQQ